MRRPGSDPVVDSEIMWARQVQAALTASATFSVGAAPPLLVAALSPGTIAVYAVSVVSLLFLAVLGCSAHVSAGPPCPGPRRVWRSGAPWRWRSRPGSGAWSARWYDGYPDTVRRYGRGSWQCLCGGEVLQSSEQVWSGLQNQWRAPLFRHAPAQWRCGALAGSMKVGSASGERVAVCAWANGTLAASARRSVSARLFMCVLPPSPGRRRAEQV